MSFGYDLVTMCATKVAYDKIFSRIIYSKNTSITKIQYSKLNQKEYSKLKKKKKKNRSRNRNSLIEQILSRLAHANLFTVCLMFLLSLFLFRSLMDTLFQSFPQFVLFHLLFYVAFSCKHQQLNLPRYKCLMVLTQFQ